MPISYRSGSNGSNTLGGVLVINAPAGVQNGDFLVATTVTDNTAYPAGSLFNLQLGGNQSGGFVVLGFRIATVGEPSTYTLGVPAANYVTAIIDCWSGVSQVDAASVILQGTTTDVVYPDITALTSNCLHYVSYQGTGGSPSPVTPVGYSLRSIQPTDPQAGYDKIIPAAGLITGVKSIGAGQAAGWTSFSTLLRPASGTLLGAGSM